MKYRIIRWGISESIVAEFAHKEDAERFLEDYKWRYQGECYAFLEYI